jgi:hypothetical protein
VQSQPAELKEISVEQVIKWEKGNDLWAAVLLEPSEKSSTLDDQCRLNGIPDQIKNMIHEYDPIFKPPLNFHLPGYMITSFHCYPTLHQSIAGLIGTLQNKKMK